MTKGILAAAERFREPNVLSSMTKGMLDPVEKIGRPQLARQDGNFDSNHVREDRLQWLGLHVYDEASQTLRSLVPLQEMVLPRSLKAWPQEGLSMPLSYGSIVREPSRAFTSYMEKNRRPCAGNDSRGREVLDLALVLGSNPFSGHERSDGAVACSRKQNLDRPIGPNSRQLRHWTCSTWSATSL